MFKLDHFVEEANWTLDKWGSNVCIFYTIRIKEIDEINQRIYLLRSGFFYSPLFRNISFSNDFLIKTKETKYISITPDPSEFMFPSSRNRCPNEILKQKLRHIEERNSIFTKEDMPCLI